MKVRSGGVFLLHLKPVCTLPFISIENLGKHYACLRLQYTCLKRIRILKLFLPYAIILKNEAILMPHGQDKTADSQNISEHPRRFRFKQ